MTEKAAPKVGQALRATEFVLRKAAELGFARVGVTDIATPAHYDSYQAWLARGDHGSMSYMEDDFHQRARADMRELLADARAAIVVALAYDKAQPEGHSPAPGARRSEVRGRVAQYALGDDYHHIIRDKLRALGEALSDELAQELGDELGQAPGRPLSYRACVDSTPLLERELAERAGLGFVAKNTMLISPGLGSYTLLGVLLVSINMQPTKAPAARDCGTCTACLEACPTQAFSGPYKLDARLCISYLTIESRAAIPNELRDKLGDRIFGCDECQDVCPYNARAPLRLPGAPELRARDAERARPDLPALASLGSNPRKRYFRASAMQRNSREQLLRNICVALGNQAPPPEAEGEAEAEAEREPGADPVTRCLDSLAQDPSSLVREHADWALAKRRR